MRNIREAKTFRPILYPIQKWYPPKPFDFEGGTFSIPCVVLSKHRFLCYGRYVFICHYSSEPVPPTGLDGEEGALPLPEAPGLAGVEIPRKGVEL